MALPQNAAVGCVQRINIIRFSDCDNHGLAAGSVFDVERLRVNVSGNGAEKIGIALECGGGGAGESRVDEKAVAIFVVVVLSYVDRALHGGSSSQGN